MSAFATLTPTTLVRRTHQANDSEYLTAAQLMGRYGVSHMWLLRRMAKDGFPKPAYFGRLRVGTLIKSEIAGKAVPVTVQLDAEIRQVSTSTVWGILPGAN